MARTVRSSYWTAVKSRNLLGAEDVAKHMSTCQTLTRSIVNPIWSVSLFFQWVAFATAVADSVPARRENPSLCVTDSIVDGGGLNFAQGAYGTCINGQTFQQEALVSFRGYQYAAYFREAGVLCVGRRKLPSGEWQSIRFLDTVIRHTDVHNVAVIGICPADGTIHLAFDHHCGPMHYKRSAANLALHPEQFQWTLDQFGKTTNALVVGQPLPDVTYPQFFAVPNGNLQLLFRRGTSGDGDWHLAEYNPAAQGWTLLGILFSRVGEFETSPSRCAYPNPLRYGPDQRLHVTWCWRERPKDGPTDLRTNHDLGYAYSDDFGRSWKNNGGEVVTVIDGSQEKIAPSIQLNTPGAVVRRTRYLWGQMNTTTEHVDGSGIVHVINWQHQQDAAAASMDMNTWRYYHYWREPEGKWNEGQLPFFGRKPQIVVDRAGKAYVVYCQGKNLNYHGQDPGGILTVAVADQRTRWQDWKTLWTSSLKHVGEPLLDLARWNAEQVLSIYTQEQPVKPGAPSSLHVVDIRAVEGL